MASKGRTVVDTFRATVADATAATSVNVKTKESVPGVRLEAGPTEVVQKDSIEELVHRFSPDFILFPEATAGSSRPSRGGNEDYHPRPVEAYVRSAKPYVATPSGLLAGIYVTVLSALAVYVAMFWLLTLVGRERPVSNEYLLLGALALFLVFVTLQHQAPSLTELRERIAQNQRTKRLGIRQTSIELPFGWWPRQAWKDYQRNVVAPKIYPPVTYARPVRADVPGELYLQYWQFYVFNDWHNHHEADWEVVVVRIADTKDGWQPVGAAYSSHLGGHWRPRPEVTWRGGTHPLVYVARGSHAQYFESKPEGYRATLKQAFGLYELQIRRKDWTDVLAGEPIPDAKPIPYTIEIMPPIVDDVAWTPEEYERWWWLRYEGAWGGSGAIPGPREQGGGKWSNPLAWIEQDVDRDAASWATLKAVGASDD